MAASSIDGSDPAAAVGISPVILHLGAHKTASTRLQRSLLAARADLAEQGCAYIGPDLTRRHYLVRSLGRPARALWRKHAALRDDLAGLRRAGQRIVISDENFLGTTRPPELCAGGQLYPNAARNLAALLASLDLRGVRIALALRDPLGLLASAWGHQFLAHKPVAYAEFAAGVAPLGLRWPELVARLRDVPGVAGVVLWRYEDALALDARLAQALCGFEVPMLEGAHLAGPSARAIAFIQRKLAQEPAFPVRKALRQALNRFPKSADWPGPDPFGAQDREQSARQYRNDWAALQTMPGVVCLTP